MLRQKLCLTLLMVLGLHLRSASAAPATRPAQGFPAGQDHCTIPLVRARDFVLAEPTLNGQKLGYFLIDTGAEISVLRTDLAKRLKPRVLGPHKISAVGGPVDGELVAIQRIDLGPLSVHNLPTFVPRRFLMHINIDDAAAGVIGMDILGRGPFTLDLAAPSLTLYDPERFSPPNASNFIPLRARSQRAEIAATIEGIRGWFILDSGADSEVLLSRAFVEANSQLSDQHARVYSPDSREWGAGRSLTFFSHWSDFRFLSHQLPLVHGAYQRSPSMLDGSAGLVGVPLLRDARLTVDIANGRMWVRWPDDEPVDHLLARLGEVSRREASGDVALHHAARRGRSDAVIALLKRGADPNAGGFLGETPLLLAAQRGDDASVAALLAAGARINFRVAADVGGAGLAALHIAARFGHASTVSLLLERGALVDLADNSGRTALFHAAEAQFPQIVELLLKHGAAADRRTIAHIDKPAVAPGETPLLAAARNCDERSLSLLLAAHADPNVVSADGFTPLFWTAYRGSASCVRLFLDHRAQVNLHGSNGAAPLFGAVATSRGDVCAELLLKAGANTTEAYGGLTPLEFARSRGTASNLRRLLPPATQATSAPAHSARFPFELTE